MGGDHGDLSGVAIRISFIDKPQQHSIIHQSPTNEPTVITTRSQTYRGHINTKFTPGAVAANSAKTQAT